VIFFASPLPPTSMDCMAVAAWQQLAQAAQTCDGGEGDAGAGGGANGA
jgi:hypothetical protein